MCAVDEAALLRAALQAVEWVENNDYLCGSFCPWCENDQEQGHRVDCLRQISLSADAAKIARWRVKYDAEERRRGV